MINVCHTTCPWIVKARVFVFITFSVQRQGQVKDVYGRHAAWYVGVSVLDRCHRLTVELTALVDVN